MNGRPSKKKVDLKRYNPNSFNSYGMNLYGPFFTSTAPHLEFSEACIDGNDLLAKVKIISKI